MTYNTEFDIIAEIVKALGGEMGVYDSKYSLALKLEKQIKSIKPVNPEVVITYEVEGVPTKFEKVSSDANQKTFTYIAKTFRNGVLIDTKTYTGVLNIEANTTRNWRYYDMAFVSAVGSMHYISIEQKPMPGGWGPDY